MHMKHIEVLLKALKERERERERERGRERKRECERASLIQLMKPNILKLA